MPGSLEGVLANIPFYGGYVAKQRFNQQQQEGDLQQASGTMGVLAAIQKMQSDKAMKEAMAASGGDVDKAMQTLLSSGNIAGAHALAPVYKIAQDKKQAEEMAQGLRMLNAPPGTTGGGPGGEAATPPAAPGAAPVDPRKERLDRLTKMQELYAKNPAMVARIQTEMDKLQNPPDKTRTYQKGEDVITEERQPDGSWKELGRGPKFAKQVEDPNAMAGPTKDTIEMDAWRYLTDGTLPPNMGRGQQGAGQAAAIRNRASELAKEMKMSPDEIRFGQLTNRAGVQAIGQLAKSRAQILQFEKTAMANADLALNASNEVWRSDSPWFNKPMQQIQAGATSDPKLAKFNAANETFVNEYARVMSGGYGAAQTTEGAQQRAATLLSKAMSPQTYRVVVDQLRAEMKNREKALNDQMDEERARVRGQIRPNAAPAAAPTAAPAAAPSSVDKLLEKYK